MDKVNFFILLLFVLTLSFIMWIHHMEMKFLIQVCATGELATANALELLIKK